MTPAPGLTLELIVQVCVLVAGVTALIIAMKTHVGGLATAVHELRDEIRCFRQDTEERFEAHATRMATHADRLRDLEYKAGLRTLGSV